MLLLSTVFRGISAVSTIRSIGIHVEMSAYAVSTIVCIDATISGKCHDPGEWPINVTSDEYSVFGLLGAMRRHYRIPSSVMASR